MAPEAWEGSHTFKSGILLPKFIITPDTSIAWELQCGFYLCTPHVFTKRCV